MHTVQLTEQFKADLFEIFEYISNEFGVARKDKFQEELGYYLESLADANIQGKQIDQRKEIYKILFQRRDEIYYKIERDKFVYLRILVTKFNKKFK